MPPQFTIRAFVPEDIEAIVRMHYEAVHELAREHYPPEILDAWSLPAFEERAAKMREWRFWETEIVLVAESEGHMVGFATLLPEVGELRAVYVNPKMKQQGVGTALLNQLEGAARERGVKALWLRSSLNAEPF